MLLTTFQDVFPKFYDFSEFTLIDLIQIVATLALGAAAVFISVLSYKANKRSIAHDIKKSEFEAKIALFPKRMGVLQLINDSLFGKKNFGFELKESTIQLAFSIFPSEIALSIKNLLESLFEYNKNNKIDETYLKKFANHLYITTLDAEGRDTSYKMFFGYVLEFEEISKTCEPLVNLSNIHK